MPSKLMSRISVVSLFESSADPCGDIIFDNSIVLTLEYDY